MEIDYTNEVMMNHYKKQELIKAKKRLEEKMSKNDILKLADKRFITEAEIKEALGFDFIENEITNKGENSKNVMIHKKDITAGENKIKAILIGDSELEDFPNQPFKSYDEDKKKEMIESIKNFGIMQPLIVRPIGNGKYQILAGHNRRNCARELEIDSFGVEELIRATGKVEEYLLPGQDINDENLRLKFANIIYKTGRVEEYLTPEKIEEFKFCYISDIASLIKATGKVEEYLIPGQDINDENLRLNLANLIYKTGRVEEYLTPDCVEIYNLHSSGIVSLIKATGKIEEYLIPEKVKELNLASPDITILIKATGKIKEYLTAEKLKTLGVKPPEITSLIKDMGNVEEFLLPGQDINDELYISNVYYREKKEEFSEAMLETLGKLFQKNSSVYSTINLDIILDTEMTNIFNEEQLIRITNYPKVQEFFLRNNNNLMIECLKHLMKKDENWIISLDKIIKHETNYRDLIHKLSYIENKQNTEDFIEDFLTVISDSENYFNIQNYDDVNNYSNKRNEVCLNILNGNLEDLPESFKKNSESDLYKFALLEYKFGINLEEAKRLIVRYGTDSDKLPDNTISEYIRLLKTIVKYDNMKDVVNYAIKNNLLGQSWIGFPNARNAEGNILNMFSELYNTTLYNTKIEDKSDIQESYIDKNGTKHKIEIYEIKKDFNMNARVEGAYSFFIEPENFNKYYENPNIENHGNCESYIGNDSICIARNFYGIIVGYDYIYTNTLTSAGSYDLSTSNTEFSIYNERSDFRIPEEMKNHTRHTHNEMVKERLIIDKNGNVVKCKPSYVVWIEEDPKVEREKPSWKQQRENNAQWIMTKKAAGQLGVPIVVIDREYFAQRETDKIDLMKKLILGEEIDEVKYKEYIPQYSNLSKC